MGGKRREGSCCGAHFHFRVERKSPKVGLLHTCTHTYMAFRAGDDDQSDHTELKRWLWTARSLLLQASSAFSLAGSGFDLGIEAEAGEVRSSTGGRLEGTLPPLVSAAWQKTGDYERARQFIFRSRGAIVVSEAHCITHKVKGLLT